MADAPASPAPAPAGNEARALTRLALPLIGSNLAAIALTTTDTLMVGWYDVTALAGLSLAAPFFFVLFIVGSGFSFAVLPMVAAAAGAGDETRARRATRMGLWLSALWGIAGTVPLVLAEPILLAAGQRAEVAAEAGAYLRIAGFGLTLHVLTMCLKSFLSGLEHTRVVLWVTAGVAVLNLPLNYALIFGHWGMPELGIRGAAAASVIVQALSVAGLAVYAARALPEFEIFRNLHRPDWEALARVFRVGMPIGLTSFAEVGLFSVSSLMMGWVGTVPLAAHGIALQIASVTFMVHFGLSSAVTVRVGRARGRGEPATLRAAALAGLALSGGMVVLTVTAFLLLPRPLVAMFVDPGDPAREAILATGAMLLAYAALFQVVDAGQAMALGMLRGVEDTRVPMWIASASYWLVGIPAGWALAFPMRYGAAGIWIGMTLGLALAALFLNLRFWGRLGR